MAAHAAAGNRGEALLAYQRLRRVLADELGVDPDAETEAAYLQLLGPAPPARVASGGKGDDDAEAADAASGVTAPAPFVGREQPSWPCSALPGIEPPPAPATSSS